MNQDALPSKESLSGSQYEWGVWSGPLVDSADIESLKGNTWMEVNGNWEQTEAYMGWMAQELPVYYEWESGADSHANAVFLLDSSGDIVSFSPPERPTFTVPANTNGNKPYGDFAGSQLQLEYVGEVLGEVHSGARRG